jgi:hypothetical protein
MYCLEKADKYFINKPQEILKIYITKMCMIKYILDLEEIDDIIKSKSYSLVLGDIRDLCMKGISIHIDRFKTLSEKNEHNYFHYFEYCFNKAEYRDFYKSNGLDMRIRFEISNHVDYAHTKLTKFKFVELDIKGILMTRKKHESEKDEIVLVEKPIYDKLMNYYYLKDKDSNYFDNIEIVRYSDNSKDQFLNKRVKIEYPVDDAMNLITEIQRGRNKRFVLR